MYLYSRTLCIPRKNKRKRNLSLRLLKGLTNDVSANFPRAGSQSLASPVKSGGKSPRITARDVCGSA